MKTTVHRIGALTATLCIAIFFTSTVIVELFGSQETIAMVKSLKVMHGLLILVTAIADKGETGIAMSGNRNESLMDNKKKRM